MSAEKTLRQDEELAFDVAIDEPPQKLWRALTEAPIVERWLAPVIDRSREPGRAEERLHLPIDRSGAEPLRQLHLARSGSRLQHRHLLDQRTQRWLFTPVDRPQRPAARLHDCSGRRDRHPACVLP